MKKLKIKFWKAERALVMQILEQEGLPKLKVDGKIRIVNSPAMHDDMIYLRGKEPCYDFLTESCYFGSNQDRDEYLDSLVNTITDELFTGTGELKVGEMCKVSDDELNWHTRIYAGKSAKELGLDRRVLAVHGYAERMLTRWRHVRAVEKSTKPMVEFNDEIVTYTWEER